MSKGQADYENDVKRRPLYHDGTPRKKWEELGEIERWSWKREDVACEDCGGTVE